MTFGLQEIIVGIGAILTTWIFNNVKLREGLTDVFLSNLGGGNYNIKNHNVLVTLKAIKFESKLNEFDNDLKTELYYYYIDTFLDNMTKLIEDILEKGQKISFEDSKKLIKTLMLDTLSLINVEIDDKVKMPNQLQDKFDKFKNYLTLQHTYAIENALKAKNKKMLLLQVFDAIENNSRWFLFYSTEMFDNFNGHFDTLSHTDIFLN
jgi:hypothetical protein